MNGILEILREAFRGLRRSLTLLEETGVREYGEEGSLMMLARRGRYENRFRFSADCCSGSRESDEDEDSLKSSIWSSVNPWVFKGPQGLWRALPYIEHSKSIGWTGGIPANIFV